MRLSQPGFGPLGGRERIVSQYLQFAQKLLALDRLGVAVVKDCFHAGHLLGAWTLERELPGLGFSSKLPPLKPTVERMVDGSAASLNDV